MGSIGSSSTTGSTPMWEQGITPEADLHIGKRTKLSEKMYRASFRELGELHDRLKEEDRDSFMLSDFYGYNGEKTLLSTQQYTAMQHEINRGVSGAITDHKLGVIDDEQYKRERRILNALQKTLNKRWRIHKD